MLSGVGLPGEDGGDELERPQWSEVVAGKWLGAKLDALRSPELHANIQDVFNEHGVQIMSPAYEADPAESKIVPPDKWYEAPAKKPE